MSRMCINMDSRISRYVNGNDTVVGMRLTLGLAGREDSRRCEREVRINDGQPAVHNSRNFIPTRSRRAKVTARFC